MLASLPVLRFAMLVNINGYHLLIMLIVSIALLSICHIISNRYLHPLHNFPGPFWGSVTDLYNTYLFSTYNFHEQQLKLHKQYGQE